MLRGDVRAVQTLVVSLVVVRRRSASSRSAPYLQRYQLFYTGVDPVKARTALSQFLTIHGLLLFLGGSLFAWYFVLAQRRALAAVARQTAGRRARLLRHDPAGRQRLATGSPSLLGGWSALGVARPGLRRRRLQPRAACWSSASAVAAAALLSTLASLEPRLPGRRCSALALFATLIPEFVALQGDIGRMNTVFKFYLQAWVLLSITGAVALAWLVQQVAAATRSCAWSARPGWWPLVDPRSAPRVAYPLLASKGKIGLRFTDCRSSLDGMAYMDHATYSIDRLRPDRTRSRPEPARRRRRPSAGCRTTSRARQSSSRAARRSTAGARASPSTPGCPPSWAGTSTRASSAPATRPCSRSASNDVERAYASTNPADALDVIRTAIACVRSWSADSSVHTIPPPGWPSSRNMPELRLVYEPGRRPDLRGGVISALIQLGVGCAVSVLADLPAAASRSP